MNGQDYAQLTLFPAGSPASHSVLPGSSEARKMTVTSGRRCLELYRNSGPLGSLVRMCLGLSIWRSTRCYLTWKLSATPSRRLLFRLQASMPRTDANELPLWPTPRANDGEKRGNVSSDPRNELPGAVRFWPTPTVMDSKGLDTHLRKDCTSTRSVLLSQKVAMFATPQHRGFRTGQKSRWENPERSRNLNDQIGGQLNPTWVEWLMGFPIGWTDLNASETP